MQIPNLRELRELHGLTQKELADVSGVSLRSVAGYEGGAHVRPNTARKLAHALNVEVVELVGADSYPKAQAPPSQRGLFNGLEEVRRSSKTVTGGAHLSGTGKLTAAGEVVARIMQIMDKRREEKISDEEVVEQIRELFAA